MTNQGISEQSGRPGCKGFGNQVNWGKGYSCNVKEQNKRAIFEVRLWKVSWGFSMLHQVAKLDLLDEGRKIFQISAHNL